MRNMTTKEVEAKRDSLFRLLKNTSTHQQSIRDQYDRCVEELIRRGFNEAQAKS